MTIEMRTQVNDGQRSKTTALDEAILRAREHHEYFTVDTNRGKLAFVSCDYALLENGSALKDNGFFREEITAARLTAVNQDGVGIIVWRRTEDGRGMVRRVLHAAVKRLKETPR